MKKIFSLSLPVIMASILFSSCEKNSAAPSIAPEDGALGAVVVSFSPEGLPTKAQSSSVDESRLETVQIIVFNALSRKKETDKYVVSPASTVTLSTLIGEKRIWVIGNAPKLNVATEADLRASVSHLGENSLTALTMVGVAASSTPGVLPHEPGTVTVGAYTVGDDTTLTPVSVPIYRLGARVSLNKVTVDFSDNYLKNATFVIKDIYLKNVVNAVNFDGTPAGLSNSAYWTNRITDHAPNGAGIYVDSEGNSVSSLLADKSLNLTSSATDGTAPITVSRNWYVYPNSNASDVTELTWSPRHTRLVVHAQVTSTENGMSNKDTYYVFPLPSASVPAESANVILGNHTYDISNISISMLGKDNDDDDTMTETGKASITISVQGWTDPYTIEYSI